MKKMNRREFLTLTGAAVVALSLAGCGGAAASAAPAGSGAASQSAAAAAVQTAQKERITDQYTLEKNVSGEWEADTGQYISVHVSVHVPQLECDSPDAASINDELNDIYAADFREFENSEEAGQLGGEAPLIGVGWDDWWYGDCVSLVVRSRYGGTAPWRYSGWCFDFATGQQITTAEMLQRMGLDPDTVQQQMQRQAMQTFDREMAQGAYYESWRLDGELSQMRMDTLEYNELENLCLLLPEQNQLVIRGRYSSASEERWQQLDMEIPLQTAAQPQAQPVLTDTYDGVQVQLKGTQATITVSPAPRTATWDTELNLRLEQAYTYPILGSYNEYSPCPGKERLERCSPSARGHSQPQIHSRDNHAARAAHRPACPHAPHGRCGADERGLAMVSLYPLWKADDHTGQPRRGQDLLCHASCGGLHQPKAFTRYGDP